MRFLTSLVLYLPWVAWVTAHSDTTNAADLRTRSSDSYIAVAYFVNWVSLYRTNQGISKDFELTDCAGRQYMAGTSTLLTFLPVT